jgi:DNA mismatch endonuclease (patch repair protein)
VYALQVRSKIMASIHAKDTKPEMLIRKLLYAKGYRYRIHYKGLPGKPDLVLPKHQAAIFVNGCFWHGHDCHIFNPKRKLSIAWATKIKNNVKRDDNNLDKLHAMNWKTLIVWECAIDGKEKLPRVELFRTIESWLLYDPLNAEVVGRKKPSP